MAPGTDPAVLRALEELLPGRCSTRPADLEAASRDASSLPGARPDVVVWPLSTDEVAAVVRLAYERAVPLTARGAGSSLEGNPIPVRGGIVLDCARMVEVVSVRPADLQVDVQPGVVYAALNRRLKPYGLFFPPHPGGSAETATIGGMVANNASGIYSVRYGGTRDYVRAATVVSGTGEVIRLGSACRKTSSGYHLIGLLVGSEGTLAIATEIILALAPLPQAHQRAAVCFPSEGEAAAAIADMMRYGVALAAVEFLDRRCVTAVNRLLASSIPAQPLILLELHGDQRTVAEQRATAMELCGEHAGTAVGDGTDP